MNNARKFIDQILRLIDGEANKTKKNNQSLTEDFFNNENLHIIVKTSALKIFQIFDYEELSGHDFEKFYKIALTEFKSNHPIEISPSISLRRLKKESWLTQKRIETDIEKEWSYSGRYFRYLADTKGRSKKIIDETKSSSRKILGKLGDPKSEQAFYIKGLAVGSVQSGKTENFNAVINAALDSGYYLIIVLAGIMEDLRRQTQLRIENDVAGYGVINIETGNKGIKGVGKSISFGENGITDVQQVIIPTSVKQDFTMALKEADFSLNKRNILVCKKNVSVLRNLILWLSDYLKDNQQKHDMPLLIIDDEADNASLNNMGAKGAEYASKTNSRIRALLGLFTRKSYLGYTATPFANVLQDRNEASDLKEIIEYNLNGVKKVKEFERVDRLFPDDFIELIYPPSNYIGAKHFFETRIEEIKKIDPLIAPVIIDHIPSFPVYVDKYGDAVLNIEDADYKRKSRKDDSFPEFLPISLKEAIQCFVISTALRLSRKAVMSDSQQFNPHNTMLIHVSRFTNWQSRTKELVDTYLNENIIHRINNDLPSDPASIYAEFERTWNKHFANVVENIKSYLSVEYEDDFLIPKTFSKDIKPLLVEAANGIEVKAINSQTGDSLLYHENNPRKYIAIGGNRLSRGFTLEGLTINYFIRNTDYADTLLQMGRWFGYRPGYLDCCKLFTTSVNLDKFDRVTHTIEELEQEFAAMSKKDKTPENYILRVRSHPKVLNITRSSILMNTVSEKVNFSGDIEQSTQFIIDKQRIEKAWSSFTSHVKNHKWFSDDDRGFFIHQTNSEGLLEFLNLDNTFFNLDLPGLPQWLKLCNERGYLTNWTIAVKRNRNSKSKSLSSLISNLPGDMELTIRRGPRKNTPARESLLYENIFKASGKSAQIVASGEDFSITLDSEQILSVKKNFIASMLTRLLEQHPLSLAEKKAKETTVPDRIFREEMNPRDGILIIYLIDTEKVFESEKNKLDEELINYAKSKKIDFDIPLIGYALGFPTINEDIGGDYIKGDYGIEDKEDYEDEFDEQLNEDYN